MFLFSLFLLAFFFLSGGCTPKRPTPQDRGSQAAQDLWDRFQSAQGLETPVGFSLTASLNYAGPKRKNRVVAKFWGNRGQAVRMDLEAGVGAIIAYWREGPEGFTAYVPEENAAYVHPDGRIGLAAFGFALPYSLKDLGLLLSGRLQELLPAEYESARPVEEGVEYTLVADDQRFTMVLGPDARPRFLTTPSKTGHTPWTLEVRSYLDETGPNPVPKRITMERPPTEKAIVFVKKLEYKDAPWPDQSLELDLPDQTEIRLLKDVQP